MENENKKKPVCVIVGVGPGIGAANAHKFAKAGYALALDSRSLEFINELADKLEVAKAYAFDVKNSSGIKDVFEKFSKIFGWLMFLYIVQAPALTHKEVLEILKQQQRKIWKMRGGSTL